MADIFLPHVIFLIPKIKDVLQEALDSSFKDVKFSLSTDGITVSLTKD
jgi:hypothetical protein